MTVLSVVIPAYNEEKGIAEIACRVLSVAPDLMSFFMKAACSALPTI